MNLILSYEKVTCEPGHFLQIYAPLAVFSTFFLLSLSGIPTNWANPGMYGEATVFGCVVVILMAVIAAWIGTWILTMPEDYEGFGASLKNLKPWRVERALPVYMQAPMEKPTQQNPMH